MLAVSLAPPCVTVGAPPGGTEVDEVTAEGVLMCGGAPETVGVMLEAACVLLGVVGLATVEDEPEAAPAVLVEAPPALLVEPRRGANVLVDS